MGIDVQWLSYPAGPFSYFSQRRDRPSPLATLPGDLLLEIINYLTRAETCNLTFTCSSCFHKGLPGLYSTVQLTGETQATTTLAMLARDANLARHVQKLIVRPSGSCRRSNQHCDGYVVSAAVRCTARFLDGLHTFVWEGQEVPPFDDMWFALRKSCPRLKNISTTIGAWPLSPYSHLLDFKDLRSFSLTLKLPFYIEHVGFPEHEELPASRNLWDMLIKHCPNLEELAIEGNYALSADAHLLALGHWPKLRKLTLGDVFVDWTEPPASKRPIIDFLESHSGLETLGLSRSSLSHTHLATLDHAALPRLTVFSGTFEQLQAISHLHPSIESLGFKDPMILRDITPVAIAGVLQGLTNLRRLKVTFALNSMYDSGSLLRSLVSSCPQLRHLDLTCAQKPSFQLDLFSRTICRLPKLRSLSLTIVKFPGDERLLAGAARIARANPRLRHFTIALSPPFIPIHLPFSPLPFRLPLPPVSESGSFTLSCDGHGLPARLAVRERRTWLWGFSTSTRRYEYDLRPGRGSGRRLGEMVWEASPAGEEVRMMLFCFLLVAFALAGYVGVRR